jgi:hypothetical protein
VSEYALPGRFASGTGRLGNGSLRLGDRMAQPWDAKPPQARGQFVYRCI